MWEVLVINSLSDGEVAEIGCLFDVFELFESAIDDDISETICKQFLNK